ncbi:hypothetical protein AQUCO_06400035v1 [Aquilegia coerulea]|uniref:Uncharacterized protein n=1 Tax=Aquilegia coerulea TaxID=218851 RepID=A0A2G5CCH4_AQUCA|nr:hypothetical protein AQUCO_06400035v1 [Aquilegia coerulea]
MLDLFYLLNNDSMKPSTHNPVIGDWHQTSFFSTRINLIFKVYISTGLFITKLHHGSEYVIDWKYFVINLFT